MTVSKLLDKPFMHSYGSGLHARRGLSPLVSRKLWKTYAKPRALRGIEVLKVTKADVEKIDTLQRSQIKHVQSLPGRTATTGVHILLGIEPIAPVIDKRRLSLFMNIARLEGTVENKIMSRQLAMEPEDSSSLASTAKQALKRYSLPEASQLFNYPIKKILENNDGQCCQ